MRATREAGLVGEAGPELIIPGGPLGAWPVVVIARAVADYYACARCDCPGCVPRVRYTRTLTVRMGGTSGAHIDKALDAFALARAIRFAGLNTPDSKRFGAAQTLAPP